LMHRQGIRRGEMVTQNERIRITAEQSELLIAIEGHAGDILFDARAEAPESSGDLPMDLLRISPSENADEYVVTFEFDQGDGGVPRGVRLKRLDAYVTRITVKLRDDGYVFEGELTGWVGYTDAYRAPVV
jgi:hypothetical protein